MRVKVLFSGREMDAVILERVDVASTDRPLGPLTRLISTDVVLSPQMLAVCEDVAHRCAGTVGDVLRLAIPPRHARAEKADRAAEEKEFQARADAEDAGDGESESALAPLVDRYSGLRALLSRAGAVEGPVPRAHVVLDPVDAWTSLVCQAIGELDPEAGALVIAPDHRDVQRLSRALERHGIEHETLGAADGPEKRYRAFRRILRGARRVVIGSRSAAYAPVKNLSLIIVWDEADDLHQEPRAPYASVRTVVQSRSAHERAALLFVAYSPSTTMETLSRHGYLHTLTPQPAPLTRVRPRIEAMDEYLRAREGGSGRSRIPSHALALIREGLAHGPVLVQVPRSGYVPAVACTFCGTRCVCAHCSAPLAIRGRTAQLECGICGRREDGYRCPECDRTQVRAITVGSTRTAEELRRTFPDVSMKVAGGAHGPLEDCSIDDADLVVATPGAEPWPDQGYAACLLLDADALLGRAAFDADVEALRRWRHAVAMVRPYDHGGRVLIVGTATLPAIQDFVAHRSGKFLDGVLADRELLGLPPFQRIAEVVGDRRASTEFLSLLELPASALILGPVEVDVAEERDTVRTIIRVPLADGMTLARSLKAAVAVRSARKLPGKIKVRMDPHDVL